MIKHMPAGRQQFLSNSFSVNEMSSQFLCLVLVYCTQKVSNKGSTVLTEIEGKKSSFLFISTSLTNKKKHEKFVKILPFFVNC